MPKKIAQILLFAEKGHGLAKHPVTFIQVLMGDGFHCTELYRTGIQQE